MNLLRGISPKIAVVAPDGAELWIDPLEDAQGSILNGYKVQLRLGPTPTDDARVTTSKAAFALGQGGRLLGSPGPLGLPVGVWVAGAALALAWGLTRGK